MDYTNMCLHTCLCTRVCVCMFVHTCLCTCVCLHVCAHTFVNTCVCVCVCLCVCVSVCLCVCECRQSTNQIRLVVNHDALPQSGHKRTANESERRLNSILPDHTVHSIVKGCRRGGGGGGGGGGDLGSLLAKPQVKTNPKSSPTPSQDQPQVKTNLKSRPTPSQDQPPSQAKKCLCVNLGLGGNRAEPEGNLANPEAEQRRLLDRLWHVFMTEQANPGSLSSLLDGSLGARRSEMKHDFSRGCVTEVRRPRVLHTAERVTAGGWER